MTSQSYETWLDLGPRYGPDQPGYVHKFQRAAVHFNGIHEDVMDFLSHGLHAAVPAKLEAEKDGWITIRPGPTNPAPGVLALHLGDFLNNVRATLDYLVYEVVRANGNDPGDHTAFPICETEGKWRDDITERAPGRGRAPTAGMAEDVLSLIREEQPLNEGSDKARKNHPLMHLLRMSNADKHRQLHTAAVESGNVVDVWAEPPGMVSIDKWKAMPIPQDGGTDAERVVARAKVSAIPGSDPNTGVYIGFKRPAYVTFSIPGKQWKSTVDDLVHILNAVMRVGRVLEPHVNPPGSWFNDLYMGRIGNGRNRRGLPG